MKIEIFKNILISFDNKAIGVTLTREQLLFVRLVYQFAMTFQPSRWISKPCADAIIQVVKTSFTEEYVILLALIGEHMEKRFNLKKLLATRGTKSITAIIQPSLRMYILSINRKSLYFIIILTKNILEQNHATHRRVLDGVTDGSSSTSQFQQPLVYPQDISRSRAEQSSQSTSKRRKTSNSKPKKPTGVDVNYPHTAMSEGNKREELKTLLLDQFPLPALESFPTNINLSLESSSYLPTGAQYLFRCLHTVFKLSAKYAHATDTTFDIFPFSAERIHQYWLGMNTNSKNLFSLYCNEMFYR